MDRNQTSVPPFGGRGRGRPNRGRPQGAGGTSASTAASWRSTAPATTPKSEPASLPPAASSQAPPRPASAAAVSSTAPADTPLAAPPRPRSRAPSTRRNSSRRTSVSDTAQSVDIPPLPSANTTNSQAPSSPTPNGTRSSRRAGRSRSGSKAGAHVPPPLSSSAHLPSVPAVASAPPNVSGFGTRPSIDSLVQHIRAIAIDHSNKNGDWAQDDDDTLPDLDDWNVGTEKQLSPVRETSPTELLVPPSFRDVPNSAPPDVPVHAIPANPPAQVEQPHKKARNSRGGKGKRKGQATGAGEAADGTASGAVPESTPSTLTVAPSVSARLNTTAKETPAKNASPLRKTSQTSTKREPQSKGGRPPSAASRVSPMPGASTVASVPSTSVLENKAEDASVVQTSTTSAVTLSFPVDPPTISTSVTRGDVQVSGDTTTLPRSQREPASNLENIVTLDSPTSSRPRTPRTPNLRPSSRQLGGSTPTTPIRMRRDDLPTHARTHSHDPSRSGFNRRANRETFSPTHTPSSSRPKINIDALSKITRSLGSTTPPALRSAAVSGQ